jgi:outer membrane receptor for ferrienterochelin and colicins
MQKINSGNLTLFYALVILFFVTSTIARDTGKITGRVLDNKSQEPLPGANILLVGTVLGTSSNLDGFFTITRIPAGSYELQISMMGYKQKQLKLRVQNDQTLNLGTIALETTIIETPELLITANKRRQNIQDSPVSVGVMTRRDLKRKNHVYIDKLLQYASGVNFIGSQINIRGSSGYNYGAGSRVLFLVDGVPVMPGDSGDIKWDLVPVNQIERIEIIKGAGSALYGSSALGGVINIITKQALANPVTHIRFSAGMYDDPAYETWQWTDRTLHFDNINIDHTRQLSSKADLFLAAGRQQSTGYAQNGHYQRINASAKLSLKTSQQSNLTLSSHYEGGERGTQLLWKSQRYALESNPEALGDHVRSNKFSLYGIHNWAVNKRVGLKSRVSYFRNTWKNIFHDNISASTAQRIGLEVQSDFQFTENHSLIMGMEEAWDHVNSDLVGDHDQNMISFYIQDEQIVWHTVHLSAGVRYDHQWVDIGFNDSRWSPKIGLVWHVLDRFTLRASSGSGFRAASMSERFSDSIYSGLRLLPNPDLKSETAWSHEIGFYARPLPFLFVNIAGFYNDYWDLIEPEPDANQNIRFTNVTRARITGIESHVQMVIPVLRWITDVSYTVLDPQDLDHDIPLAYRPKSMLTVSTSYRYKVAQAGIDYRYIARLDQEAVKLYPNDDRVPQKIWDAHLSLFWKNWELAAHVKNLFNHNHTQVERTLLPIRHYLLTLSSEI